MFFLLHMTSTSKKNWTFCSRIAYLTSFYNEFWNFSTNSQRYEVDSRSTTYWFPIPNTYFFLTRKKHSVIYGLLMSLIGSVIIVHVQRLILRGEQPTTMRPEKLLPSQQTDWAVLKRTQIIKSLLLRVSCKKTLPRVSANDRRAAQTDETFYRAQDDTEEACKKSDQTRVTRLNWVAWWRK